MAHAPEIRTEAFELYLAGNSPGEIAAELKRRHPATATPSAKTIEKWAYVPVDGRTWSERRYEAERAARDAVTSDFVAGKTKLLSGLLALQAKLQERALLAAQDSDIGDASQEVYAYVNATRAAAKMLESDLAEQVRAKDAVDCLIEAVRRVVPHFEQYEVRIRHEFQRLSADKAGGGS